MQIQIHYFRIDRPPEMYSEELVVDEGWRIRTLTHFPPEISDAFSMHWSESGLIPAGSEVLAVAKYMFPGEPFAIMEPLAAEKRSFGLYVDICLPLVRNEINTLELHDLMLDLWLPPSGPYQELDWDEFEQARRLGKIPQEHAEIACRAVERLRREIYLDKFPGEYIV